MRQNIMPFNLAHSFDFELREVPVDPQQYELARQYLLDRIEYEKDTPLQQLRSYYSTLSFVLKVQKDLDTALNYATEALAISKSLNIISLIVIDQMRYASILQWKKNFGEADDLFKDAIHICKTYEPLYQILDFAYHNYGKSLFDQKKYDDALGNFQMAIEIRKTREQKDLLHESEQALKITNSKLQPN